MTGGLKKRVVILISGRGSNMGALVAAAADPSFPAEIVGVISNREGAAGLETAARYGIETRIVGTSGHADKAAQDASLDAALVELKADIVCLAGYMRLLGPEFVRRWHGRLINIHPSLLPLFRGLDTHKRAVEAGVRIHGCTVHFVTPEMDEGPIIAQTAVPVLPGDSEAELSARVLRAEHKLYPLALRLVAQGRARMEAGRTVYSGIASNPDQTPSLVVPDKGGEDVDIQGLARMTP